MNDTRDIDPRFKHLEKKVGVFVLLMVVVLLAIIFFLGREKDIFTKKYILYTTTESGVGIIRGMPVKLSGFKVGRVHELSLDEDARVRVAIKINKKYQKWIRRGSIARLLKERFIGEFVLEITVGDPLQEELEEGAELPFERIGGIESLVEKARPLLKEVEGIIKYVNNPEGDVKIALNNVRKISSELVGISKEMSDTIKEIKLAVIQANKLLSSLNKDAMPMVGKVDGLLDKALNIASDAEELSKRLPAITEKTEETIENIRVLSGILAREGTDLRGLIKDSSDVLKDTKELLKGLKRIWPIRLMLPQKEGLRLLPLDGSEIKRR
jgi:phospholipid/cholesterol/gamma-HCH transport system substrate-binding protein